MKRLNKRELQSLRKEVSAEIKEIKRDIKAAEKADELSRKVDRLYDRLEGNELLLDAIDNTISNISSRLDDKGWKAVIDDFKNAVEFADNNKASFSSRDVLDRVLISYANENKKQCTMIRRKRHFYEERSETKTEKNLKAIIPLLLENKDFKALAQCSVIGCFKRASYMLGRIKVDLDNVSDQGLLSDTYLDIQSLMGDLKDCLDFVTSVNRKHFTMSSYRQLIDDLKDSISILES